MPITVKRSFNCVIFDFDGTLVDGLDAIVECSNLAFGKFDIKPPSKEDIRKRIGLPLTEIYGYFLPPDRHHQMNEVIEAYRLLAREILPQKTYLREGAKETLYYLKNLGLKLGIATTKATDTTIKTLEYLGEHGNFDEVCGIDRVKNPKPDPEQLLLVIENLKCLPEKAVMVGDTYVDVTAAKRAGVFSVAVLDGFGDRKLIDNSEPDMKLETISDLIGCGLPFEKAGNLFKG